MKLTKSPESDRQAYILRMWLMFLRAPGHKTAPGECVDLQEIGSVRDVKISRVTPYSIATTTEDFRQS